MSDGWSKLYHKAAERIGEIGPATFAVYCAVLRHTDEHGRAWPSAATIQSYTGLAKRSVWRAIKLLERGRWIGVQREHSGGRQHNVYSILPLLTSDTRAPSDTGAPGAVTPEHHGLVTPEHQEEEPLEQEPSKKTSSRPKLRFSEEDMGTARWMFEKIKELRSDTRMPSFDKWSDEVRLMRERDKRTDAEIRSVFNWANNDGFWQSNILSPSKLREKYDQLAIKMKTEGQSNGFKKNGHGSTIGPGQRHPADQQRVEGRL